MLRWMALTGWLWTAGMPLVLAEEALVNRVVGPALRLPLEPASSLESALGALRFTSPVVITSPPGETNRLFVVEQTGRIVVITNLAAPTRTTFLELTGSTVSGGEQGLLGLAFHPRYAENGRFFVFRTVRATTRGQTNRLHDRLSEFRVSADNPHRAAPAETVLFQQYDEASNHNGGDVQFGPDGFLYVTLGDEGGGNDQFSNGQTITRDFFAGILRLDVDAGAGSLLPNSHPANEAFLGNYRVPADNPFVGATQFLGRPISDPTQVRTEFYAVGLRNPWRVSFDPVTGELWVADVGQNARESIYVTRRGANHGWPFREGPIGGPRSGAPAGFTTSPEFNYVAPLHSYSHGSGPSQGRSITGGLVYRGPRFAHLSGAYLFADYVSGNVWSLRRREGAAPLVERLLGEVGISAFGRDPRDGDVLIADLDGGRVVRLVPGSAGGQPLPATLADTGAFANTAALEPVAGVIPYEVNLPFWSDGAEKRRWFHVPGTNQITFTETGAWQSPVGSVWVKHFEYPLGPLPTDARQRLETRFLVRNAAGVYGITYRWTSATNAVLVPDEGETLPITVASAEGGGTRTVTWRFPSRAECLACHNAAAGGTLSFDTAQLSRPVTHAAGQVQDQIRRWTEEGYLAQAPLDLEGVRRHPSLADEGVSLEARARSYLSVNCAPCHRPGGTVGGGFFDTRLETPTDVAGLLLGPLNDAGGDPNLAVVVPGHPEQSVLLRRVESVAADRMPPISSGVVDAEGVALLERWITSTAARPDFPSWLRERFGDEVAAAASRTRDADGDGGSDYLEYVTGTDPKDAADVWRLRVARGAGGTWRVQYRQPAGVGILFEASRDLSAAGWSAWSGFPDDGGGVSFPATASERELLLPADERPRFLRARVVVP
ncbi:MAG: PQQ-dependent sugar dehydrogenase [Verrucomicrobiales bacterium]|nr:PQQ-dependent sugar dehydrogenase [Verrucomicrobiales bacterium]